MSKPIDPEASKVLPVAVSPAPATPPPVKDIPSPHATWARDSVSTCHRVLSVPHDYPPLLNTAAWRFTGIQNAYCSGDTRAARQAFHFLQDTQISLSDPLPVATLKKDLIFAAATIATAGGYRVFADQQRSSAESTLHLIETR